MTWVPLIWSSSPYSQFHFSRSLLLVVSWDLKWPNGKFQNSTIHIFKFLAILSTKACTILLHATDLNPLFAQCTQKVHDTLSLTSSCLGPLMHCGKTTWTVFKWLSFTRVWCCQLRHPKERHKMFLLNEKVKILKSIRKEKNVLGWHCQDLC